MQFMSITNKIILGHRGQQVPERRGVLSLSYSQLGLLNQVIYVTACRGQNPPPPPGCWVGGWVDGWVGG